MSKLKNDQALRKYRVLACRFHTYCSCIVYTNYIGDYISIFFSKRINCGFERVANLKA